MVSKERESKLENRRHTAPISTSKYFGVCPLSESRVGVMARLRGNYTQSGWQIKNQGIGTAKADSSRKRREQALGISDCLFCQGQSNDSLWKRRRKAPWKTRCVFHFPTNAAAATASP